MSETKFNELTIWQLHHTWHDLNRIVGRLQDYVHQIDTDSPAGTYIEQVLIDDHKRLVVENAELQRQLDEVNEDMADIQKFFDLMHKHGATDIVLGIIKDGALSTEYRDAVGIVNRTGGA